MAPLLIKTCVVAMVIFCCVLTVAFLQLSKKGAKITAKSRLRLAFIIVPGPRTASFQSGSYTRSILNSERKKVFQFRRGSGNISSNLYRSHGCLYSVETSKNTAHLYRSIIGNSGYIELISEESEKISFGLVPSFSPLKLLKAPCDTLVLRVFVSAKLKSHEFELEINSVREKFCWSPPEFSLYLIKGSTKVLAVMVESDSGETRLFVERSIISPLLAVCLFFL